MNQKPPYALHSTTPGALAKMRSHIQPYETDVMGLPILVLPDVWSPAYDWSSRFHVAHLPDVRGRACLEIGCGTGIISVFTARTGASRVVAVDINAEAIRNTCLNFKRFNVANGEARLSNAFANVQGMFDVIIWNAPYHGSRPADTLERACTDENYHDVRVFFQKVSDHLQPDGMVIFGFSESGDIPLIETLIAENGFRARHTVSAWQEGCNFVLFFLTR
ncbi:MAG: methylase of polypeptide chain release factors-like protein [Rhodospirillaceae bacterium]|nr:MAG: methylase of polypeptide chain release factors-like protein [Rhodospirillaceae bacterium]